MQVNNNNVTKHSLEDVRVAVQQKAAAALKAVGEMPFAFFVTPGDGKGA